jgi:hypothetical protein
MTGSCRLCGQIITGSMLTAPIAQQLGVQPDSVEYQAFIAEFMKHVGAFHADYVNVLAATANTYHIHLVAKLASSSDPKFLQAREEARALAYWTLAGEFAIESKIVPPTSTPKSSPTPLPTR